MLALAAGADARSASAPVEVAVTVAQPCEISIPTGILLDASGVPRPNEAPAGSCGGSTAPQITTTEESKESGYVVSIEF